MPEITATDSPVEPSTHTGRARELAELVVRYRYADGVLIEGKTQRYRHAVKRAWPRWKWFPERRQWGMPRTRERELSAEQVEEYARGLRTAGVLNVRVDYQEPMPEVAETTEEQSTDGDEEQPDGTAVSFEQVEPLTAEDFIRWFPKPYRDAMSMVQGIRARHGFARGDDALGSPLRGVREAVKGTAGWRSEMLRGLLNPSCGDSQPASKADDDSPAPAILGERTARRAAAERARREHERAFRYHDARVLMAVRHAAASFGEVSRARFNTAYRRLHPWLDDATLRHRALVITHHGLRVEATARGPEGVEFSASLPAGSDERAVIAALLRRIEWVVRTTPPPAEAEPPSKHARGPEADEQARAEEPSANAAATGPAEPEAVADVIRAFEDLTRMVFAGQHEATGAGPGSEVDEDDATEERDLPGEHAEEPSSEDGPAGPDPRDGAVEQESVILRSSSGEDTAAPAPTEPPLAWLDVTEPDPAVLELAEHEPRWLTPDTAAPLLRQTLSEAAPNSAEDEAPPVTGNQASTQGATLCRPPPHLRAPIPRGASRGRAHRACPFGLIRPAQALPAARHRGYSPARRGRSPPTLRGQARVGLRNRGPPPHSRQ